ncbi:hypothetical protein OHS33_38730 (plasmid) [Streptomyces sp. NBC_00536]|uniref:hypothetical protein n=1 Tax=Streptomyces sp. NBC_00536 TaxID=2975769 RepID=UPI002E80031B|nr:hypothetical protein [Streptomyces sp. NBC_00536]WUC84439.1 hypothetical protein OHS33_38730 [Streptomyces sp. NBC_00536]
MPPRTRKTTSEDVEETPEAAPTTEPTVEAPEAPENKAVSVEVETKTPIVAPLEPPAEPEPVPERDPLTTAQQLLPAELGDRIVDDATGLPPADPDSVFVPVMPHGSTLRCTVRLVEHVGLGTYRTPTTRLLVPIGAELKRGQVARVVARLHEQLNPPSAAE